MKRRVSFLLATTGCALGAYLGCMPPYLDETGKTCTDTCPSGLPCIGGRCGGQAAPDATTSDVATGDGDNDSGAPTDSATPVDAGPPLKAYRYSTLTSTWSNGPLTDYWNGPNAPPPHGIVAATQLIDHDRLLVFTDDGKFYLRADGIWKPPVSIGSIWSPLTSAPYSISHVPQAWKKVNDPQAPDEETIIAVVNPKSYLFKYLPNDAVTFVGDQTIDPGDGAVAEPALTNKIRWSYEILDLGAASAEKYQFWDLYDDDYLYEVNAAIEIKRWKLSESPFWVGHPEAPPANGVAAYFDYATRIVYVIGP